MVAWLLVSADKICTFYDYFSHHNVHNLFYHHEQFLSKLNRFNADVILWFIDFKAEKIMFEPLES